MSKFIKVEVRSGKDYVEVIQGKDDKPFESKFDQDNWWYFQRKARRITNDLIAAGKKFSIVILTKKSHGAWTETAVADRKELNKALHEDVDFDNIQYVVKKSSKGKSVKKTAAPKKAKIATPVDDKTAKEIENEIDLLSAEIAAIENSNQDQVQNLTEQKRKPLVNKPKEEVA